MKKNYIQIIFILLSLSTFSQTTYTWTGATSGAWLTSTNWTAAKSPSQSTHIANFNNNTQSTSGINMNTLGGAVTIAAITFSAGATINGIANTVVRNQW